MQFNYLCFIIIYFINIINAFDPYAILNVGKSAKLPEIRKSYKQLVKEWHPDKNSSPNAQEKFIEVQQAYEILSNEEKRQQFDEHGHTNDATQQWAQPRNQHTRFNDFFREDFYFNFEQDSGSTRSISTYQFYHKVLPDSDHTPQVIYVYSTFCGQCIVILRSSWEKAAVDLEKLGLGVGTIDTTFTTRVAASLGVSRIPTTVVIYNGRYAYYKGVISYQNLKNFVKDQLPSHLVKTLTPENVDGFLGGVKQDDRPRAVLFTSQPSPTLLYTLMALKHQKYIEFGFVSFSPATKTIADRFGVKGHGPTLLIFKENQTKPSVMLQSSEMPRGAVNEILSSHHFMTIPRVTSQSIFDELCPPPSGQSFHIHICAIYCTGANPGKSDKIVENLRRLVTVAMETEDQLSDWLKFVYVRSDKQPAFVRSLSGADEVPEEPAIYLTWRRSSRRGYTTTTSAKHWHDSADLKFQKLLTLSIRTAHQRQFEREVTFAHVKDELAPFIFVRMFQSTYETVVDCIKVVARLSEQEFMLMMISTIFCGIMLYSLCFNNGKPPPRSQPTTKYSQDVSSEPGEEESYSCEENSDDDVESEESRTLTELTPQTYEDLIIRQPRGHMTLLFILEDHHDDDRMLDDFFKVMEVHSKDPRIHVACLDSNRYLSWYVELRRSSSAQPEDTGTYPANEDVSTLHNNHAPNTPPTDPNLIRHHGVVLALNGSKHWFCLFVPRSARSRKNWSLTSCNSSDDVTNHDVMNGDVRNHDVTDKDVTCEEINLSDSEISSLGVNSEPSGGDGAVFLSLGGDSAYAKALLNWRDRVLEGQMPRLYVRQWPSLYDRYDDIEDDDDVRD
ncbi:dnaJ homolog subfamily C member 16-like [Ciona intestinalis]